MKRACFVCACLLAALHAVAAAVPAKMPNILYILADDLGYGDVVCYNAQSKLPTPRINKLAAEGMRFTDAHSASACTPTRYGILTGRYAFRSRVPVNVLEAYDPPLIEEGRLTVPALLRQQGYLTACIGKWHLGWDWPRKDSASVPDFTQPIANGPVTRGFDEYFGAHVPNQPPYAFIHDDRLTVQPTAVFPGKNQELHVFKSGPMAPGWKFENIMPALAARVEEYLHARAADKKPFFLYYAFTIPHEPLAPTAEFLGKSGINRVGDLILQTDAAVGAVLDTLQKLGLENDTLVIFASDNGHGPATGVPALLKAGHDPSRPFRGFKGSLLEGGHRIPLIVRWPGKVKAGAVCDEVISLTSLMATCAELLGTKLPASAGEDSCSILPLLLGQPESYRPARTAEVHAGVRGFAVRQGPWKLVESTAKVSQPARPEALCGLYHVQSDPAETNNVIAQHAEVAAALKEQLDKIVGPDRAKPRTPAFDDEDAAAAAMKSGHAAAESSLAQFLFLRIGEVQPREWLLDQIRTDATNGYGLVLDKLTDRIEAAVFDSRNREQLVKPKIGADWWNGETTGNWLDGLIRTAYLSGDAPAKRRVDALVAQILAMQDEDGYLGIYPKAKRYESPIGIQNGELWTQACLFRGLLAYCELTGREEVLAAVQRATKVMMSKYGPERPYWRGVIGRGGPGHNIMFVDVCEWLHRLTGDASYVAFAKFLYDGYCAPTDVREADVQLRNLSDLNRPFYGHGAHVMEHLRVPLFLASAAGDANVCAAADNFFPKTARHLVAGGACISDEDILGRPGSPAIGCEYCTSLELLHTLQSGVEKTGRGQLADAIEVLAFNSAEGARQRDGKAIQYCTMDNQYEATTKGCGRRMKLSPTHEDVAVCCPVTALKFFPYFVSGLWMKTATGDGLVAVSYAPCELQTKVRGVRVRILSETGYPFEDDVRMTVEPESPVTCGIRLRMPAWAGRMRVESAGASMADDGCWRVLTKEWKAGDRIAITFMPDVERRAMADGEVYWKRGPLVFALPIASERKQVKVYPVAGFADYDCTPVAGAYWDYAVDDKSGNFQLIRTAAQGNPWVSAPVRLTGKLVSRKTGANEPVELQPMGVNLLRRVAFPDMKNVCLREAQTRLLQGKLNLARQARVEASSTAKGYAPAAIADGVTQGFPENREAEWASARETTGARVKLAWEQPVTIEAVWLFDRPNPADHVQGARITFSDGTGATAGELPNDGATPFRLSFPPKTITWMEVVVTKAGLETKNSGFSEIAVFNKGPAL